MRYFYVLDLADIKTPKDIISDVKDFVNIQGFNCMDNIQIRKLADNIQLSFVQTLRDIFIYLLEVEHAVTLRVCNGEKYKNPIHKTQFGKEYYNLTKVCTNPHFEAKCESLRVLHDEDDRFMTDHNEFLSVIKRYSEKEEKDTEIENIEESKYKHVLILLNDNKQYIGHIYIWSWLSINYEFRNMYTLEFGSIRTSLFNLMCGGHKNIAPSFITAISMWAQKHDWDYMHVAFDAIGPMPNYLKICGFSEDRLCKVSELKCVDSTQLTELHEDTHIYASILKTERSVHSWCKKKIYQNKNLIKNMWFGYDIAKDIYKLLLMSFPDRLPSIEEMNWVYVSTFKNNITGYIPPRIKKEDIHITIPEYCQVSTNINNMEEGKKKYQLQELVNNSSTNCQEEVNDKIKQFKVIHLTLINVVYTLNHIFNDEEKGYILRKKDPYTNRENTNWEEEYKIGAQVDKKRDIYIDGIFNIFRLYVQIKQFFDWYHQLKCAIKLGVNVNYKKKKMSTIFGMITKNIDIARENIKMFKYYILESPNRDNIEIMLRIIDQHYK